MSYRQPSKDIGVVKYSAIGDVADKAISSIDAAKTEIITQQKEAQAILDEKFETINDEAATENILQFGIEISDKYSGYIREAASKESIYGLGDQGIRDLKLDLNRMKKSVDKITELASTNIELSKQFDDKDLASFVADFRAGNKDNIDIEFKDGKILYKYKTDTGVKTWSGDDIIKESSKFEDVGIKRDDYNNFATKVTGATQDKIKEFANQGKQYPNDNIKKDIDTAFGALSLNQMSYLYNEVVSDEDKSGLPLAFGSRTDKDGNKLSIEEVAKIREQQKMKVKDKFKEDYNNRLSQNPLSLDRAVKSAQLAKERQELQNARSQGRALKFNVDEWEKRNISNKDLFNKLKSIEMPSLKDFKPTDSSNPNDTYESRKAKTEEELMRALSSAPIEVDGKFVAVQGVEIDEDGFAQLSGSAVGKDFYGEPTVLKVPLIKFKVDGKSFENAYKLIVNNLDKQRTSRVDTPSENEEPSVDKGNPMSRSQWIKTVPKGGDTSTEAFVKYRQSLND